MKRISDYYDLNFNYETTGPIGGSWTYFSATENGVILSCERVIDEKLIGELYYKHPFFSDFYCDKFDWFYCQKVK